MAGGGEREVWPGRGELGAGGGEEACGTACGGREQGDGGVWPRLRGWEACSWRGRRVVRRIHWAKIKSWGRAGVPGGDLFLGETDARSCKGRFVFNERIEYGQGGPTDRPRVAPASSPPLPGEGCPGLGTIEGRRWLRVWKARARPSGVRSV